MNNEAKKDNGVFEIKINEKTTEFSKPHVTGKEILEKGGFIPEECHALYRKFKGGDFEYISLSDIVDISNEEIEHFITKEPIVFNYSVNNEPETTDKKHLTPNEILELAGLNQSEFFLLQIKDGEDINYAYCLHEEIKMVCPGLKFKTEKWHEIANIEELGKTCQKVPTSRIYRIKIDKTYHNVHSPYITGEQIIELEKKSLAVPYNVLKFLSIDAKPKPVGLKETVDLREKCLIRFVLQPKEQKDGENLS